MTWYFLRFCRKMVIGEGSSLRGLRRGHGGRGGRGPLRGLGPRGGLVDSHASSSRGSRRSSRASIPIQEALSQPMVERSSSYDPS